MKKEQFTEKEAKELINGKLSRYFGVAPAEARKDQLYKAVVMSIRDIMLEKRQAFHQKKKEAKRSRQRIIHARKPRARPNTTSVPHSANSSARDFIFCYPISFPAASQYQNSQLRGVRGNGSTSRIFCTPVTNMIRRSKPTPKPA